MAVLVVVVAMVTALSWHAAMMVPAVVLAIVVLSMAGSVVVLSTEPPMCSCALRVFLLMAFLVNYPRLYPSLSLWSLWSSRSLSLLIHC